jgi:Domain of unknown function (DUF4112)
MTNFLAALRGRRFGLPDGFDRRALWQRSRAFFVGLWRPRRGADVSLPEWLHLLVGLSDDGLRIPGTPVRLGLDALLGTLLPGAGDALGGVTSATLMYVAWRRGAPRDLLFRMLGNATLDVVFGSVPVVGDIFDLGFHANRRNLTLLEEFLRQRAKAIRASKASAVLAFGLLFVVMILALAAAVGLIVVLWRTWRR